MTEAADMTSLTLRPHFVACLVAMLALAGSVSAATITVTTVADNLGDDAACSLREALDNASGDAAFWADCVAGSGADSIAFDPVLFTGASPVASIALDPNFGFFSIGGNSLTIAPPPGSRLRLAANGTHQVMYVNLTEAATFEQRDTEIRGGSQSSGGGLSVRAQFALLDGVHFIDNNAAFFGGALHRSISFQSGSLVLRNCLFEGNSAQQGAAIFQQVNADDDLLIENCRFTGNAGEFSGAIRVDVPSIATAGTPELTISDTTFLENLSQGYGGALSLNAGSSSARHLVQISNSSFVGNQADQDGGAIYQRGDPQATAVELALIGNSFHDNSAGQAGVNSRYGGALYVLDAALRLTNNLFAGNTATCCGAALWVNLQNSTLPRALALSGNSFIDNHSGNDQATRTLLIEFPSEASAWTAFLRGNAFAASEEPVPTPGECTLAGAGLQVTASANIAAHASCTFGPNDTVADPALVLAASTHPIHPLSAYPDSGSPAIDLWPTAQCLGVDGSLLNSDLLGNPRPLNGDGIGAADCDAGAFELPDAGLLSVAITGAGSGRVISDPAGIDCGSACAIGFGGGTQVALTAAAGPGSVFSGWSGDCSGTAPCLIEIDGDKTVTANFALAASHALSVATTGDGTGNVVSTPSGIACAPLCAASFAAGSQVTLTATPATDAVFSGWSGGGCSGTGSCVVTLNADTSITAEFTATAFVVEVTRVGGGFGSVESDPLGIDCPGDCSELFDRSETVTLAASASPGSSFVGWQGDCSGNADCLLDMDAGPYLVDAQFELLRLLEVGFAGSGSGSVLSNPAGIDCPGSCSAEFVNGTQVTLTPVAAPGSAFTGWGGIDSLCPGTALCVLPMNTARTVTATFQTGLATLSVSIIGGGRVTSQPAGIDCPSDCSESYSVGSQVTLSPSPTPGVTFSHWEGACSGSGACVVQMNGAQSVSAHFVPGPIFANGFE